MTDLVAQANRLLTPRRLARLRAAAACRLRGLTVAFDGLHDPHNVSAALRSCEAFGVQDVHLVGDSRTVPLNEQVQRALAEWIAQLRREGHDSPDSYLFQSRQGGNRPLSRSQASKIIHDALEAGEVQGTLGTHVMRKSFARNALALSGNNARLVQKALGHSKLSTTEAYLDVDQDAVDQVVLAM